jgi:hypothetical protein
MRRVLIAMAAVALFCMQGSAFGLVPAAEVLKGFPGPVMVPNSGGLDIGLGIDPNGAEAGLSIDPNGAETGAGLDPDG